MVWDSECKKWTKFEIDAKTRHVFFADGNIKWLLEDDGWAAYLCDGSARIRLERTRNNSVPSKQVQDFVRKSAGSFYRPPSVSDAAALYQVMLTWIVDGDTVNFATWDLPSQAQSDEFFAELHAAAEECVGDYMTSVEGETEDAE